MYKKNKTDSQKELVIKTFDKLSQTYDEQRYFGCSSPAHSFMIRRQRVYELLSNCRGGKVLDVGCGPGITVDYFVDKGFEFFGVDISKEMINRCKEKFGHVQNTHFSVGSIEKLDFPNSFFDVVICMGVVEYTEDDSIAVKEMTRVTKQGGIIIITLPNKLSPFHTWNRSTCNKFARNFLKKIVGRKTEEALIHREYKEADYIRLLSSYALKVTDIVYYDFKILIYPLDRLLPGLTVLISRKLEFLCRSKLRWLGTGFIVKTEKTAELKKK